jgi:hypothetical protein
MPREFVAREPNKRGRLCGPRHLALREPARTHHVGLLECGRRAEIPDHRPIGSRSERRALAVQAPDRDTAAALIKDERTGFDVFKDVEVHDWEFGGRR